MNTPSGLVLSVQYAIKPLSQLEFGLKIAIMGFFSLILSVETAKQSLESLRGGKNDHIIV